MADATLKPNPPKSSRQDGSKPQISPIYNPYKSPWGIVALIIGILVAVMVSPVSGIIITSVAWTILMMRAGTGVFSKRSKNGEKFTTSRFAIWIIAFIVVVFVGIFTLGIFSGPIDVPGMPCTPSPTFLCQNPILVANGNLSFEMGQSSGNQIYNVAVECSANTSDSTIPSISSSSMVYLSSTGVATLVNPGSGQGALSLASGQSIYVTGLKCFEAIPQPLAFPALGTWFHGSIYISYTHNNTAPGGSNPIQTQRLATLNIKIV